MLTVSPFEAQHVSPAAYLFTDAYGRLLSDNRFLPPQFGHVAEIEPMLGKISADQHGAVAYVDGQFAGYLIGYSSIPGFFGRGPGVFVPVWGHGVAVPHETDDVFSALYAEMSAQWVECGCHTHAISIFADDSRDLQELLFQFGFGMQVIDGIRSLDPVAAHDSDSAGGSAEDIRPASAEDVAAIRELDGKLGDHLRSAPIFLDTHPEPDDDLAQQFMGEGVRTYLAWRDGVAVGGIRGVLNAGPGSELFNVDGTLGVNFAYTDERARSAGVASKLLNELLQWGRTQGMVRCAVDFESANLLARRFWLGHFQPICYSVVRKVDDRM
jgi:GNAT superfamily N-acetyltransferase